MNLEQLSTMTEAELQANANEHLERLDVPMVVSSATETHKQYQIAQAQIFLAELDRRKQAKERIESEKIAARDYKLELWVIGLIGAELLLALVGIIVGWVEGSKQMDVLDKLNKSSAETVATLTTLQKEQEAALETQKHTLENIVTMNDALQDEMDLNLTQAIQFGGSGGDANGVQKIYFANNSKVILFFWGSKFDGQSPKMQHKATSLPPGKSVGFEVAALIKHFLQTRGSPGETSILVELYFKRENGTQYVARGVMQVNPNGTAWIDGMTSTRKQW
jgi:hypothetical protein